jgi:hypothetical protein
MGECGRSKTIVIGTLVVTVLSATAALAQPPGTIGRNQTHGTSAPYQYRPRVQQVSCSCCAPHPGISCDCAARLRAADGVGAPGASTPDSGAPGARSSESSPAVEPAEAPIADTALLDQSVGFGFGFESGAPNLIGDFFGGGSQVITVRQTTPTNIFVRGELAGNSPPAGATNAIWIYESSIGTANDFTSNGFGIDTTGDGTADTFRISEPLPPNDSNVSPGPGYVFDGGTAVYTGSQARTTALPGPVPDQSIWYAQYSFSQTITVDVPSGGGAVVRRVKLAENNSPIPRDRLFGLYNFFNDVPNGFGDVSRYALGFEKTFRDGGMSLDVRFPFAATLSSDQSTGGIGSKNTEFGNTTLIWKSLLFEDATLLVSGGLGVALPTANDTRLFLANGRQILQINNDAVHLLPFGAFLATPNDQTFFQAFCQLDLDPNGDRVQGDPNGGPMQRIGTLQDATLLFLDGTLGMWAYRNPYARAVTGIAPVIELHYSSTLQDTESLTGNGFTVNGVSRRFDVLNGTICTHFFLGDQLTVTPAISFPLRNGNDQQFDYEAIVQANWYF